MMELILKSIWLLLPAGIANMSPVLFKWIPFLNSPVDGGLLFRGKPLFGKNKTWRGFLFGTLMAVGAVYIQTLLADQMSAYSVINYAEVNAWYLGFLLGFGALFGDMIESFFKRQVGVDSGKPLPPFDQIDWIIGGFALVHFFYQPVSWQIWITGIIIFGVLHPIINLLGYWMGIKKNKI